MKPFVLSLSKHERLLANLRQFYSPFDTLRACPVLDTGANVARVDEMIVNRLLAHETAEWLALRLGLEQGIEFAGQAAFHNFQ